MNIEHSAFLEDGGQMVTVDMLQMQAAAEAQTVGSFRSNFHAKIRHAVDTGTLADSDHAEERMNIIDAVTSQNTAIALAATENGVLGYNTIGGGKSGIHLSKATFAFARSADASRDIHQTIAHEAAHGRQVLFHGELMMHGEEIDPLLLYEGHAEIAGNEAIGRGVTAHREGQPEEVYGEGQRIALEIIRHAGRAAFEQALTGDGDLSRLQEKLTAQAV